MKSARVNNVDIIGEGTERTEGTALIPQDISGSPGSDGFGNRGNRASMINPIMPVEEPPVDLREKEVVRPGFTAHDDFLLLNGALQKPGLYYHGWDRSDHSKPIDIWVSSPIHAMAITAGENDRDFGLLLKFINAHGRWQQWAMPMALLKGSGEELRGELLNLGVRISPKFKGMLNEFLMGVFPHRRVVAAVRTGWHEINGKSAFVLPDETIGSDNIHYQSEYAAHDQFEKAGGLDGWREQVAAMCSGNPVLEFANSTAFAGALLKRAKLQEVGGTGIHFLGDSSQGKTTALQVATSVWGSPKSVRTWRATANGLEATAASLNDTLLTLDEISEADPREIGAIIYALANGSGKQRAARSGGARQAARWRLMVLSSGERSVAAHMGEANQQAKAGQEARLLNLPVTNRSHGVFDHLHDRADGRAFADELKRATGAHYGHAGRAFVEALIADERDLAAVYTDARSRGEFYSSDGLEARAAGVFALIGIAGELATDYGITGWEGGAAMRAAVEMYTIWRDFRGPGQTEDRQIQQAIRGFIMEHGDSRFSLLQEAADGTRVLRRAGHWKDVPQTDGSNRRVYYFTSAALKEAARGHDLKRILNAVDSAGWIFERDKGKRSKKVAVGGGVKHNLYAICLDDDGDIE